MGAPFGWRGGHSTAFSELNCAKASIVAQGESWLNLDRNRNRRKKQLPRPNQQKVRTGHPVVLDIDAAC